jgi:hypothetical protein
MVGACFRWHGWIGALRQADVESGGETRGSSALVAGGTSRFDRSADRYSIGAGFFDPTRGARGTTSEAGTSPFGSVGYASDLLSFSTRLRYSSSTALQCDDVRAGCPARPKS